MIAGMLHGEAAAFRRLATLSGRARLQARRRGMPAALGAVLGDRKKAARRGIAGRFGVVR